MSKELKGLCIGGSCDGKFITRKDGQDSITRDLECYTYKPIEMLDDDNSLQVRGIWLHQDFSLSMAIDRLFNVYSRNMRSKQEPEQ